MLNFLMFCSLAGAAFAARGADITESSRVTLVAIPYLSIQNDEERPLILRARDQLAHVDVLQVDSISDHGGVGQWLMVWTVRGDVGEVLHWAAHRKQADRLPAQVFERAFPPSRGLGSPYDVLVRLKRLTTLAPPEEKDYVRGWIKRMATIDARLTPAQREWFNADYYRPVLDMRYLYAHCDVDLVREGSSASL